MYKKQNKGHKRKTGTWFKLGGQCLKARVQGVPICTVLLLQLKGVMACKLAESCLLVSRERSLLSKPP